MVLKNTASKFGSLTKFLHWSIFILFSIQFFLIYRREYFPKGSPEKLQYMLWHKSIGVLLLLMALAMIIWRHVSTRPFMPQNMSTKEIVLAKVTHALLYLMMLIMPITGVLMSQFGGYAISFFNLFNLPTLLNKNEQLAKVFHSIHEVSSYAVLVLVGLHIIGALIHHFIRKDGVLKRMLPE